MANLPNCEIGASLEVLAKSIALFNEEHAKPEGKRNRSIEMAHLATIGAFNALAKPNENRTKLELCTLLCPHCEKNAVIEFSEPIIMYRLPLECPDASDDIVNIETWGEDNNT